MTLIIWVWDDGYDHLLDNINNNTLKSIEKENRIQSNINNNNYNKN